MKKDLRFRLHLRSGIKNKQTDSCYSLFWPLTEKKKLLKIISYPFVQLRGCTHVTETLVATSILLLRMYAMLLFCLPYKLGVCLRQQNGSSVYRTNTKIDTSFFFSQTGPPHCSLLN